MNHAYIENTRSGYIVKARFINPKTGHYAFAPLRCFREQSAAFEFRDYLNGAKCEDADKAMVNFVATYDAEVQYTYPEFLQRGKIRLRRTVYD